MEKSLSYLRLQRTRKQRDIHTQRDWNPDTNAQATASAKTAHHLPHSQHERVAQPNVPHRSFVPALPSPALTCARILCTIFFVSLGYSRIF
jgi:hypothetical protein